MNSSRKPDENDTQKPFSFHDLAFSTGGLCFPESGIWNVKSWSTFLNCSEQTVLRWVKKYQVPVIRPGSEIFISAQKLIEHIPLEIIGDGKEEIEEDPK